MPPAALEISPQSPRETVLSARRLGRESPELQQEVKLLPSWVSLTGQIISREITVCGNEVTGL